MDFLLRTLLFYILSHAYLFWSFYRLFGKRRIFFITLPLFGVMGLFPYLYHLLPSGILQDSFGRAGTVWLPTAFFFLIVFILADLFSFAALLFGRFLPVGIIFRGRFFFSRKAYFLLLVLITACLYTYGVYEAHNLRVTRFTLETGKITEPLRIVFLADMHIGPQIGVNMLENTVDKVLAQEADLILLGGDLLDDAFQGTPEDIQQLQRLKAPLGSYTVFGNHDSFGSFQYAEDTILQTGIVLLSDEVLETSPVRIVGIDDPEVAEQKGNAESKVSRLFKGASEKFTILLDHRPRIHEDAAGMFDIQLSGHSHGGQIVMLQPLLELSYGTRTGYSEQAGSALFVTTGTGFSKLPIRLFTPPEIVVIDLKPL